MSQNNGSNDVFTIAVLSGPSSMGMIQLIDSINNSPNSDIKIEILDEPLQVRKMMLDGSAHFAILPGTMAALMYNKGVDYRMIAVTGWGSLYLLGYDTTITSFEHLRGKTINVMARGMTPDILFRYLLQSNEIDPDRGVLLDYSFSTHIDLANALAAGHVKLGVVSEPLATLVLDKNRDVAVIMDLNKEWNNRQGVPMIQTAFVGSYRVMRENLEITAKITDAYQRSVEWVNNNPDSAAVLVVKYNILPEIELALRSIPRSNISFVPAATIREGINSYFDLFYKVNPEIIGGKMPDEKFIY